MREQPIIVIGMHRSGSSLLSSILEYLGIFCGYLKEENNESVFFMMLNQWILRQANASWDNPYNFSYMDDSLHSKLAHAVEILLASTDNRHFLGPRISESTSDIRKLDIKWGWKDPRNTFTIDIWKLIFPNARLIHIYRNPVDVAQSLRVREIEWRQNTEDYLNTNGYSNVIRKNIQLQQSARLLHLHEGVRLWKDYIEKAASLEEEFGERLLNVRYEDMLDNPDIVLRNVAHHAGIKPEASKINECKSLINNSRKYAFTKNHELVDYYTSIKSDKRMKILGYHDIV